MHDSIRSAAVFLLLAASAAAQTTGVPGANDLQIRLPPLYALQGSATTSCNMVAVVTATPPFVVAYETTSIGATAAFLILGGVGCTPAGFPWLPTATAACAGPAAGAPLTNLWLSINFGGPWPIVVSGVISTTGQTRWNFTIPGPFPPIWAQAVFLDTCSPTGFKFSQALGFS